MTEEKGLRLTLFGPILKAHLISRPNRFLIECDLEGRVIHAFLPNPGRLQELLLPGRLVYLVEEKGSPHRKTRYTAVAILRQGHPIMLHTHKTNEVARFLLQMGKVPGLKGAQILRSEVRMGPSRFDFLLRKGKQAILLEVKSCTLVGERAAMFPDAVTKRGARHLRELAALSDQGMKAFLLLIIHWPFATHFMPDYHTDLEFSKVLLGLRHKVRIVPLALRWQEDLSLPSFVRRLQIPWRLIEREAQDRGSYLLILILKRSRKIPIGKLGVLRFRKGFYIYVGSAMVRLSQRVERHRHLRKRPHWHIDALRAKSQFHSALMIRSSTRLECEIAEALSGISEWSVRGFGCSDCSCKSHLFGMTKDPLHAEAFHQILQHFRMDRLLHPSNGTKPSSPSPYFRCLA